MKQISRRRHMQTALKQGTENVTENVQEPEQSDFEMQPLRQYLGLLRMNVSRYEYLKESGAPDAILYIEKGLIDRQILFLSRVCRELSK
jgi:hypothetical protein